MNQRLCVLGECMLEVSAEHLTSSKAAAELSYGCDTLNTAVYYARLGGNGRPSGAGVYPETVCLPQLDWPRQ